MELTYGSTGPAVAELQKNLNALGFNCGPVDGKFYGMTLGALKRYQQARNLNPDGIAGPITQGSIVRDLSNASNSNVTTVRTRDIQAKLKSLAQSTGNPALDPGPIDDIYGRQTRAAVFAFQKANGLAQDGIVGPQTLRALFGQNEPQPVPQPQPVSQPAKIGKKIAVRQGHGDSDPGAVSGQFIEKEMNEISAKRLYNNLIQKGFDCIYISGPDINAGVKQANDWGADLFVSNHHNAGGGDGFEVIHTINGNSPGVNLAQLIAEEFTALGQNTHGQGAMSKQGNNGDYYAEIRETKMPAVICEFAFIDSPDVSIVDTKQELEAEGDAIFRAICRFYGV